MKVCVSASNDRTGPEASPTMTTAQAWTLVVAISGFLLACCSLGWQTYVFRASGAKVKAALMVGGVLNGRWTGEAPKAGTWQQVLADWEQQSLIPMFGIQVTNTGRQAITVTGIESVVDTGQRAGGGHHRGPDFPHRLEPNDLADWFISADDVTEFILMMNARRADIALPRKFRMQVQLGNGKTAVSSESIAWAELSAWAKGRPTPEEFRNLGIY